ncbi:hypothetical protein QQF73_04310 [Marinobacter sp. M216]|uniref:Uncharacterized protein n=1 Tax=Marinobacter albus TaxID=3030833 RepID=A0ABT7H941_9GAMM|nr:hypothetical protein [Marinobacter sp. M216]MDK9556839.1 hypothetical protein [Marinobacter sp. M216]
MSTKLKIDISTGFLEVEGSEEFVKLIYEDFKDRWVSKSTAPEEVQTTPESEESKPKTTKAKKSSSNGASPSKAKPKKAPEFLKNLDLSGPGDSPSLKDFFSSYEHKTNYERNLIFVHYLKEILGIEKVTLDHVFTCYRNVGQKIPKALEQSLRDTSKDRGWVDIDDLEDIKVPVAGYNHITHDMEKSS